MTARSSISPSGPRLATGLGLGVRADDTVFEVMGTRAHLLVVDGSADLLRDARRFVEELEDHWTRFRPDSDVSRLNDAEGAWTPVHPDTLVLLDRARTGWQVTDGRFDPTVLPAVLAAGYDTTFAAVAEREDPPRANGCAVPGPGGAMSPGIWAAPGLGGLQLDRTGQRARLPRGAAVDPGAIGKGLAADLVVERLLGRGVGGAMANIGGDLRVAGRPPGPGGWGVEVVVPGGGQTLLLAMAEGAVATSTPTYRRWRHHGRVAHHLIDPTTGQPARDPARSATVVAGTGWLSEVLATSLVIGGPPGDLAAVGATGLLTHDDGRIQYLPGLKEYTR